MSDRELLRKQLIVDDDEIQSGVEDLVQKLIRFCVLDKRGNVHIRAKNLSSRDRVKLVVAARSLAARLDESIASTVTLDDVALSTGLPRDQLRARMSDVVKERFAVTKAGSYEAVFPKVGAFLDALSAKE